MTGGGRRRCRRRRLNQGHHRAGFLGEDGNRALLLLQERGGGMDLGAGGVILLLHGGGGGDHGIEFLAEVGGLGCLAGVVGGHQMWFHGARKSGTDHRRCSERTEGGRPLEFERSGSQRKT
jgi:hypothetical protein